jgi:hypothetical protein
MLQEIVLQETLCSWLSYNVTVGSSILTRVNLFVADDETCMGQLCALCMGEE